jgi:hypothetical protein
MTWMPANEQQRHRFVTAAILIVGLAAAFVIYLTAQTAAANPLGDPEDSKKYLRDMEVYGGTANLLATQIRVWFDGLWHGERLAYTIATFTLLSAGAYWFAVTRLRLEPDDDPAGRESRGPSS